MKVGNVELTDWILLGKILELLKNGRCGRIRQKSTSPFIISLGTE